MDLGLEPLLSSSSILMRDRVNCYSKALSASIRRLRSSRSSTSIGRTGANATGLPDSGDPGTTQKRRGALPLPFSIVFFIRKPATAALPNLENSELTVGTAECIEPRFLAIGMDGDGMPEGYERNLLAKEVFITEPSAA